MNIHILTIPHGEQEYSTVGNWWIDEAGDLQIRVSKLDRTGLSYSRRSHMERLIAVHEMIEALLCIDRGISDEEVTAFDRWWHADRMGLDVPDLVLEPGDDPAAPYREEHFFATTIERLLASELRVDWQDYEAAISELDDGQD